MYVFLWQPFPSLGDESGRSRRTDAAGVRAGGGDVRPLLLSWHHEADIGAAPRDMQHTELEAQ